MYKSSAWYEPNSVNKVRRYSSERNCAKSLLHRLSHSYCIVQSSKLCDNELVGWFYFHGIPLRVLFTKHLSHNRRILFSVIYFCIIHCNTNILQSKEHFILGECFDQFYNSWDLEKMVKSMYFHPNPPPFFLLVTPSYLCSSGYQTLTYELSFCELPFAIVLNY